MKTKILAALAATSALIPAPAFAQASEMDMLREQVATMRAEVERLSARLEAMEAQPAAPPPVAVAVAVAPPAAPAPAAGSPIEITWKGAPEIEGEGGWSFKPRGRLNFDAGFVSAPDSTGRSDGFGSEARRARLGVEGTIPGNFGYKFEVDFAGDSTEIADAIITHSANGLTITAGQHNNFQSLEELTSSRYSSFIERAAFTDAFAFERRVGLSAAYTGGDILVQAGVFSDNLGDLPGSKAWSLDGRVVYMPKVDGAQIHLGGSIHLTDVPTGSTVRYRQRPLVHFTSERFIDTGNLTASRELGIGAEAAVISGPFHAAAEAFWQSVNRPGALADPGFFGGYVEVGYYLTEGDKRGYKGGTFDRTRPAHGIESGGPGAWQINLRYDHLDLGDAGIAGGTQHGYLASLVWVPTAYTRLMLNYGRLDYSGAVYAAAGGDRNYSVDSLGMRAQIDF